MCVILPGLHRLPKYLTLPVMKRETDVYCVCLMRFVLIQLSGMLAKFTTSEISMFYLVSVAEQAGLSLILKISFHTSRGGSRISGKRVQMYKEEVRFANFISLFLNIP